MNYLEAIILGVVEGITEFLPVSSTGHLTIAQHLLGFDTRDLTFTALTAVIQLGAVAATFIYFRKDIKHFILSALGPFINKTGYNRQDFKFSWYIAAGSLPIGITGFVFRDIITGALRSPYVCAIALILWSFVMYAADVKCKGTKSETQAGFRDILWIGIVQCFALVPGVSRSGATISAGMWRGLSRVSSARLSFFLAIPALTGAGIFELKDFNPAVISWQILIVSTVTAFITAYYSIAFLLKVISNYSLKWFIYYRIFAGFFILLGLHFNWI